VPEEFTGAKMPDELAGTYAPTKENIDIVDISTSAPSFTSAAIVNSLTGRGGCVL
jgi:hypothetical protein